MNSLKLSQMEDNINKLSLDEQLWLVERLVHNIRETTNKKKYQFENDLAIMADDPQIQSELRKIEEEFAFTEADGLNIE